MSEVFSIPLSNHATLHAMDKDVTPEELAHRPHRRTREVPAESVAYTVCQHYGLDTSDYSFGYVAGRNSSKELSQLKAPLETIRATANDLITKIDGHLAQLQQEREDPTGGGLYYLERAGQPYP